MSSSSKSFDERFGEELDWIMGKGPNRRPAKKSAPPTNKRLLFVEMPSEHNGALENALAEVFQKYGIQAYAFKGKPPDKARLTARVAAPTNHSETESSSS